MILIGQHSSPCVRCKSHRIKGVGLGGFNCIPVAQPARDWLLDLLGKGGWCY
jgi:hypothetical protein